MQTSDFDYHLPLELIAQEPCAERDQSRLLTIDRTAGVIAHRSFRDLKAYLRPGDVLVLNNSKVIPARMRATNRKSGGRFEILLVEETARNNWWAMMRPGKRARIGTEVTLLNRSGESTAFTGTVEEVNEEGHRRIQFRGTEEIVGELEMIGEVPLPPYIERKSGEHAADRERYQTVFAGPAGSVAAPTAGLHFTPEFLENLRAMGVQHCFVTLHVGLGTFAPVKAEELTEHTMHAERFHVSERTATLINEAKREGRRVMAVGTTVVRVLESVGETGQVNAGPGRTSIFIYPPREFKIVDLLLTNFHLPRSTLLMLVSAFADPGGDRGRELVLRAYHEAVQAKFRFFSYGDAMLLI